MRSDYKRSKYKSLSKHLYIVSLFRKTRTESLTKGGICRSRDMWQADRAVAVGCVCLFIQITELSSQRFVFCFCALTKNWQMFFFFPSAFVPLVVHNLNITNPVYREYCIYILLFSKCIVFIICLRKQKFVLFYLWCAQENEISSYCDCTVTFYDHLLPCIYSSLSRYSSYPYQLSIWW